MSLDAPLVAAATLRRESLADFDSMADDATYQLQLAHVLLDGGYDGVSTMGEALEGGDHGLGTLDRLDGELVIVDGVPWQIDFRGVATIVAPEAPIPFAIVGTLHNPSTSRVRDCSLENVASQIEELVDDAGAVVAVRVEGTFQRVLLRSVRPQERPYRPYSEVVLTDEVRWELAPFEGVFIGFRFPDISGGDIIPGLHLHGLSSDQSTGGHNYELHVTDAVVSVGVSHEIIVALPDRGMVDLLETPHSLRMVQRVLLRRGPRSAEEVAGSLSISPGEAVRRLEWLAERGFVEELAAGVAGLGGTTRWRMRLAPKNARTGRRPSDLLTDL